MFKICNDKAYYVVQTTSEDVVVEISTRPSLVIGSWMTRQPARHIVSML